MSGRVDGAGQNPIENLIGHDEPMTSEPTLTDDQAEFVADAFNLGDVLDHTGPTGRGEMGFVLRLTTDAGSWAVKRLLHRQREFEVREDLEFVTAARAAGVPTPAILTTRDGAVLLDLPDGQVRVNEWVDLAEVDSLLDPAAVGAAVGALHRAPFRGSRGEDSWYREPVGAQRWDELVASLKAERAPFAGDLAELRDEFVALERILVDPQDRRSCHRDLFPENLRRTSDGSACVIDWDNHGLAGASQELAFVLWGFAGGRVQRAKEIAESYAESGGSGRVRTPGDFTMLIATLGHINERACTRWLNHPSDDPERERMAALFGETVADPLTREVITELLDAVT